MRQYVAHLHPYRHLWAPFPKAGSTWEGVKLTRSAWDSNWLSASEKWVAVVETPLEHGDVVLLDSGKPGLIPEPAALPRLRHGYTVLGVEFAPFGEDFLGTCGEDATTKLWRIPRNLPPGAVLSTPVQTLRGHRRKVGSLKFHPTVDSLLTTSSPDNSLIFWDLETAQIRRAIHEEHTSYIHSMDWNYDGSLLATNGHDKFLRILDPRQQSVVTKIDSHQGVKSGRALWCGKTNYIFSVGFSRSSTREIRIVDPRKTDSAIHVKELDALAGGIMPFYDEDLDIVYLAGKVLASIFRLLLPPILSLPFLRKILAYFFCPS
jgi:WD40 repeat protein